MMRPGVAQVVFGDWQLWLSFGGNGSVVIWRTQPASTFAWQGVWVFSFSSASLRLLEDSRRPNQLSNNSDLSNLLLLVPLDGGLCALLDQCGDEVRTNDVAPEPLLLQQLEVLERWARIGEIFEVRRLAPVLQVLEVLDKGGLLEELLGGEVIQIVWVGERLDKLELNLEARVAAIFGLAGTTVLTLARNGGRCL